MARGNKREIDRARAQNRQQTSGKQEDAKKRMERDADALRAKQAAALARKEEEKKNGGGQPVPKGGKVVKGGFSTKQSKAAQEKGPKPIQKPKKKK